MNSSSSVRPSLAPDAAHSGGFVWYICIWYIIIVCRRVSASEKMAPEIHNNYIYSISCSPWQYRVFDLSKEQVHIGYLEDGSRVVW